MASTPSRPFVRVLGLVALLALAGAACGDDDVPLDSGREPGQIEEGTYVATEVTESGATRELVPGTSITMRLEGGAVSVNAGCNSLGGQYSVEAGVLEVGDMSMTEMGCDPPRHAQDEWVATFLSSGPTVGAQATGFALDNGTVRIVFVDRDVADPPPPLVGTRWMLTGFIDGDVASSTSSDQPQEAFVLFEDNGLVTGHDGCNRFGFGQVGEGSVYEVADGTITLPRDRGSTLAGCEHDVSEQVFAALTGTVSYEIDGQNLTLVAADGRGATFRAADD